MGSFFYNYSIIKMKSHSLPEMAQNKYNVAVFDADFPQHSLMKMKTRDLVMVVENEALKKLAYKQFTTVNKKAYPIIQHKADTEGSVSPERGQHHRNMHSSRSE